MKKYINDAKSEERTNTFFTYTGWRSAYFCGDTDLYKQLKGYFQSRGYKIEKIPAKVDLSNGILLEYAKEVISWA